jgi:putative nucleotidyltransferase with HDIG domain
MSKKGISNLMNDHLMWKLHLWDNESKTKNVKFREIPPYQDCELGKWLHSDNLAEYGGFPEIIQLQQVHQEFHLLAEEIQANQSYENFQVLVRFQKLQTLSDQILLFLLQLEGHSKRVEIQNLIAFFGKTISLRTPYTLEHSERVAVLSVEIGNKIGLHPDEQETLHYAATLHDIGKVGISEYVLNKNTKLTEAEFVMVKYHAALGYNLLQPLNLDSRIPLCVLSHHENFDGSGYPKGLTGENIPLFSRIIRIADSYDALTSDRPYRMAYNSEKAIRILRQDAHCFDPHLFNEFLELKAEES